MNIIETFKNDYNINIGDEVIVTKVKEGSFYNVNVGNICTIISKEAIEDKESCPKYNSFCNKVSKEYCYALQVKDSFKLGFSCSLQFRKMRK